MSIQDQLSQLFRDWGSEMNKGERKNLRNKASRASSVNSWRRGWMASVVTSGTAAGAIGGPWSAAALVADLAWCRNVSPVACLGIGVILNCDIDFDQDMNLIMAVWSGVGVTSAVVPAGKIGVKTAPKISVKVGTKIAPKLSGKLAGKMAGKVIGKVVSKTALKSTSKAFAKLTEKIVAKSVAKVSAKFATKVGVGWIPIVGGIVSGGINFWLLETLMDAAYEYYTNPYVVFDKSDLEI